MVPQRVFAEVAVHIGVKGDVEFTVEAAVIGHARQRVNMRPALGCSEVGLIAVMIVTEN